MGEARHLCHVHSREFGSDLFDAVRSSPRRLITCSEESLATRHLCARQRHAVDVDVDIEGVVLWGRSAGLAGVRQVE